MKLGNSGGLSAFKILYKAETGDLYSAHGGSPS